MDSLSAQHFKKKNVSISDEMEIISYDDLASFHLAPGDVFYTSPSGKIRKILTAGESVSCSLIPKFYSKGITEFYIEYKINSSNVNFLCSFIEDYLNTENEQQRLNLREQYLSWYSACFWKKTKKASELDLIHSFNKTLFCLSDSIIEELQTHDLITYYRSFKVGAHLFSFALIFGHTDPIYLKELYNIALLFDYGLHQENLSFHLIQASNAERLIPGTGMKYLIDNNCSKEQISYFKEHPRFGYENLERFLSENFNFYELGKLILIHHEAIDGLGFPNNFKEQDLLLIECLAILCERMIPFEKEFSPAEDVQGVLRKYLEPIKKYHYSPVLRLIDRLIELLDQAKEAA